MGHPSLELRDKTAVVVGGTSGIGLILAKGLAVAGANVMATGRREDLVRQVTSDLRALGRKSLAISCDVTEGKTMDHLLIAVSKEFGSVQILVNCAGRTKRTPTLQLTEEEWNGILETNLTGTLRTCRAFGRHMAT